MGKTYTASAHYGATVARDHNIRNKKVVSKEEHIDLNRPHEIWHDERPVAAYHRIFDRAQREYNERQTREERKIRNYYDTVQKSGNQQHPVYEVIITIGNKDNPVPEDAGKAVLREFNDGWGDRNPNMEMIGSYYHADEEGVPHIHIDYIPVAHGYTRGMETQNGLKRALGEMGFERQGKVNAQQLWQEREKAVLYDICREHGLEIENPEEKRSHEDTKAYKEKKILEKEVETLRQQKTIMQKQLSELEICRNSEENELRNIKGRLNALRAEFDGIIALKQEEYHKAWEKPEWRIFDRKEMGFGKNRQTFVLVPEQVFKERINLTEFYRSIEVFHDNIKHYTDSRIHWFDMERELHTANMTISNMKEQHQTEVSKLWNDIDAYHHGYYSLPKPQRTIFMNGYLQYSVETMIKNEYEIIPAAFNLDKLTSDITELWVNAGKRLSISDISDLCAGSDKQMQESPFFTTEKGQNIISSIGNALDTLHAAQPVPELDWDLER